MSLVENASSSQTAKRSSLPIATTHFDMKLQVLIHGIDVVEDVLNYPGDDAHPIRVMEIPLQTN